MESMPEDTRTVQIRFVSDEGVVAATPIEVHTGIANDELGIVLNTVLKNEIPVPYLFFIDDKQVKKTVETTISDLNVNAEKTIDVIYQPQAVFRVRPVTRCTSSMPGHAEAVVAVSFSPNSKSLASGSGDKTVRLWDMNTQTPQLTLIGHQQCVLCVSWAPNGKRLASACKAGNILIWDPESGKQVGRNLRGHKKRINGLSWEPYHQDTECRKLASASSDGDCRIWDTQLCQCLLIISGHKSDVTAVRWGSAGIIYTASKDRTIKMWRASDGVLCRTFSGHAHWVNMIALNTDYVLRCGPFQPAKKWSSVSTENEDALKNEALALLKNICPSGVESLVSSSDDNSLFLWRNDQTQCVQRLTGHQGVVMDVKFSPNVKMIASASFDKSVRLWRASDGQFITTFRGHVQAVFVLGWSADSRLILSGSKDSTLKVWSVESKKLAADLPGHADEVFAVDWCLDGSTVASGGKDKVIKIWSH